MQLGTPFAVTEEGDAHPEFKRVLAGARRGHGRVHQRRRPAGARRGHALAEELEHLPKLTAAARTKPRCTLAFDCLAQCGLRDGTPGGQFCIDKQLAAALRGDVKKGLFFRGAARCPSASRSAACAI